MPHFRLKILSFGHENEIQAGGLKFTFFFLIVLFAAVNTGNNLIFLVLAALCSALLTSWILAWLSMRKLEASTRFPDEIFAGEDTAIEFFVTKGVSLSPAHFLTLSLKGGGRHESYKPFIHHLENESHRRIQGFYRFSRRGSYSIHGVQVTCDYPLGLITYRRLFHQQHELIVYPRLLDVELLSQKGHEGTHSLDSILRGRDGGLRNIRPFVPGDDQRYLHWKATAKLGSMMIKELAMEESRSFWVHFNPLRLRAESSMDNELFETGVSITATLVQLGRTESAQMLLSAPGLRLSPGRNDEHVKDFLDYLATVQPLGKLLSEQGRLPDRRGDELVVVVDPLNADVDWGPESLVLDRHFTAEVMAEVKRQ